MTKLVYTFGDGEAEGRARNHDVLGGKGANLAEMCSLGLPVPPGFTIVADACSAYYTAGRRIDTVLKDEIRRGLETIEVIDRPALRRKGPAVAFVRALRCPHFHAGHDGYGSQSRSQRRDRAGART